MEGKEKKGKDRGRRFPQTEIYHYTTEYLIYWACPCLSGLPKFSPNRYNSGLLFVASLLRCYCTLMMNLYVIIAGATQGPDLQNILRR